MAQQELIGAGETARIVGVHRQTIWRRTKSGKLKAAMDVGTKERPQYRYSRAYIERKAAEYSQGSSQPQQPQAKAPRPHRGGSHNV
jgi:predicted DNA-binding protein (UPF0251 family)